MPKNGQDIQKQVNNWPEAPYILEFFREAGALVAGAEAFVNINMYMAKVVS